MRSLAMMLMVVTFLGLLDTAEAQRRRRRRRRPEPQQTEEPASEPEEQAAEETPPPEEPPAEGEATGEAQTEEPTEAAVEAEPEPEPEPEVNVAEEEASTIPDLSPLRSDFATLMDELVQARSRIAVLGRQLFQTKVRVSIENRADDQVLQALSVRLDGAPVFQADGAVGDEGRQVFEGFAAPGPHELGVELEQRARENDEYRYMQRDRFRFQVVQGKVTEIVIRLDDYSDMAEDFEDDGEGEYDVRMRIRVATRELESEN